MEQKGQVRFEWREGVALVCALGRGALDTDPQAKWLSASVLAYMAACHRAGGAEAFERLPGRTRERILSDEMKATRGALARLGDLGLVVWDFACEGDALAYKLTELGWRTALCFGRRVAGERRPALGARESVAVVGSA